MGEHLLQGVDVEAIGHEALGGVFDLVVLRVRAGEDEAVDRGVRDALGLGVALVGNAGLRHCFRHV